MGGLVDGAALGAAFDVLFISVVAAAQKTVGFSSDLNRLKSTLSSIKPVIDDVENFDKILKRPQHETEAFRIRLIEGEKLIRKCSQVKWFNVFKRWYYSRKLIKLEASLKNFFQIQVTALQLRETRSNSVVLDKLHQKLNEITMMMRQLNRCTCRDVSPVADSCEGTPIDLERGSVVEPSAS